MSYREFYCEDIITLCNEYIANCQTRRQTNKEKWIDKFTTQKKGFWIFKKTFDVSRERAEIDLKDWYNNILNDQFLLCDPNIFNYECECLLETDREIEVKKLLSLASARGKNGKIFVGEEYSFLFN